MFNFACVFKVSQIVKLLFFNYIEDKIYPKHNSLRMSTLKFTFGTLGQ